MESLRLEGSTIRGMAGGRSINCIVNSAPAGLALPSGAYLLRVENNPVYGVLLSIEGITPGVNTSSHHFKLPPSTVNISPSAVATLVPAGRPATATSSGIRPPATLKDSPAALKDAPAAYDLSAGKYFGSGAGSSTTRVIIAVRPIGQQSLVAQAGFNDLVSAVEQAGGAFPLIVP